MRLIPEKGEIVARLERLGTQRSKLMMSESTGYLSRNSTNWFIKGAPEYVRWKGAGETHHPKAGRGAARVLLLEHTWALLAAALLNLSVFFALMKTILGLCEESLACSLQGSTGAWWQ